MDGLEVARRSGRVGGRRPVVDDDKRAAILARRERGESIRTIAAGVKGSRSASCTIARRRVMGTVTVCTADVPSRTDALGDDRQDL
ncbi:hypothetical protein GCM10023085_16380 [Actinomadura viridis]